MELKDTIGLMISPDYKKRFIAEYWQLKIRYNKLKQMYLNMQTGKLDFTPTCSKEVYKEQLAAMQNYLKVLEDRALIEQIDLSRKENGYFVSDRITRKKTLSEIDRDSRANIELAKTLLETDNEEELNRIHVSIFKSKYTLNNEVHMHTQELALEKLGMIEDFEDSTGIEITDIIYKM